MTVMEKALDLQELQARMRTTREGFYSQRKRGTAPPCAVIGNRLMARESDVEAWLRAKFEREPVGPTDHEEWVNGVPLLTLEETAMRAFLAPRTIRRMRHDGRAPRGAVVCGRLLFREDDVDAWVQAQFEAARA